MVTQRRADGLTDVFWEITPLYLVQEYCEFVPVRAEWEASIDLDVRCKPATNDAIEFSCLSINAEVTTGGAWGGIYHTWK
jgi:hypothetical protein